MTRKEPFHLRLARLRQHAGLSVSKVSQEAKLSHTYLTDLERGGRRAMTPDSATRLAKALGVSLRELDAPLAVIVMSGNVTDVAALIPNRRYGRVTA